MLLQPMDKTFSLEFNPLMNVKSVKDYEEEIERLKKEVFDLKTHIASNNVQMGAENLPQILFEQNKKFEELIKEKQGLEKSVSEMSARIEQVSQEKMILENKYAQDMMFCNDKMGLLEDENKRLIHRQDAVNGEAAGISQLKNAYGELQIQNNMLRQQLQNAEKLHEQFKYDSDTKKEALKTQLVEAKQKLENRANESAFEREKLTKMAEREHSQLQQSSALANELRETLKNEIEERQRLQSEYLELEKGLQAITGAKYNTLPEYIHKLEREGKIFSAGMEKFRNILVQKITRMRNEVGLLSKRAEDIKKQTALTGDDIRFLDKLNIRRTSLSAMIVGFKDTYFALHRKIELLQNEAKDATFFASNNQHAHDAKTQALLGEFNKQLTEAMREFLACKKYLEKKAQENKLLKNENSQLLKELASFRPSSNMAYGGLVDGFKLHSKAV
ncbi:hypothetical protein ENBRE01_2782 [Enteropsectra breve]|nr:hypothetical protein ENBRE01_2782 [Enteropsectra breve]